MKYKLLSVHINRGEKYPERIPMIVVAIQTQHVATGKTYLQARPFVESRKAFAVACIIIESFRALKSFLEGKNGPGWEFA